MRTRGSDSASGAFSPNRHRRPHAERADELEIAARLSSGATLVFATRMERNMRTERMTPSVTGQASFKTVR